MRGPALKRGMGSASRLLGDRFPAAEISQYADKRGDELPVAFSYTSLETGVSVTE